MKHSFIYSLFILTHCSLMPMEIDIYKKLEIAHQEKNLSLYKICAAKILPLDLCKHIDTVYAFIHNQKIKEAFTKNIIIDEKKSYNTSRPKLIMSNDGHYFAHNIVLELCGSTMQVLDIENKSINQFISPSRNLSISFNLDSKSYITKEPLGTFFYKRNESLNYRLLDKETRCPSVIFSNDGQHIVLETDDGGSFSAYRLFSLHPQIINTLLETTLKKDLIGGRTVIFHPNNQQLIINYGGNKLHLYTIATQEDIVMTQPDDKVYVIRAMSVTADNKRIMAKRDLTDYGKHDYALFNIENLDNVTCVTIPTQSCFGEKQLPVLYIPYKSMLTHIANQGRTLEILDEKLQLIASHTTTNNVYITALAVNNSGNYLAAGYSDGTIMIWHLFDITHFKDEKIFQKTNRVVKKLTFSENQFLLSESECGDFWNTVDPSPTIAQAILWDIHGNEVINFGDNIVNSIMSKNGKSIVIISGTLKSTNNPLSAWKQLLTLTTYHNKNHVDYISNNEYTLSQLKMLMGQS